MIKNAGKVQLKVTKESIESVDILVCNHEEADICLRYMSRMQLNIEIRKSIWFLMTHAVVLGVATVIKPLEQGRSGTCKNCVTCVSQNGGFRKKNLSQVCHKILAILSG